MLDRRKPVTTICSFRIASRHNTSASRKVRDINEAEADVVVNEITKIVGDPSLEDRSIGVISLIGNTQAGSLFRPP
jgi:hypothetical protein